MDEDWQIGYEDGYEGYAPEPDKSSSYYEGWHQGDDDREQEDEDS